MRIVSSASADRDYDEQNKNLLRELKKGNSRGNLHTNSTKLLKTAKKVSQLGKSAADLNHYVSNLGILPMKENRLLSIYGFPSGGVMVATGSKKQKTKMAPNAQVMSSHGGILVSVGPKSTKKKGGRQQSPPFEDIQIS